MACEIWKLTYGILNRDVAIDSWNFSQKVHFLDILVIFRLDLAQITFDLVENAFATQQLTFLATSMAF